MKETIPELKYNQIYDTSSDFVNYHDDYLSTDLPIPTLDKMISYMPIKNFQGCELESKTRASFVHYLECYNRSKS